MSVNIHFSLSLRTGPAAGLLSKYEGMCHSGHNDLIYTLALSHSDKPPMDHSDLSEGEQPSP